MVYLFSNIFFEMKRIMRESEQRTATNHFMETWTGKSYEKDESQKFWIQLLGVEHAAVFIKFEDQVHLDNTGFIRRHDSIICGTF